MAISYSIIIGVSASVLATGIIFYRYLFTRFFIKRFTIFNKAINEWIGKDLTTFIRELNALKKQRAAAEKIIEIIDERGDILSELDDLQKKYNFLINRAKFSYAGFTIALLMSLVPSYIPITSQQLWSNATSLVFLISIALTGLLGWGFFDLSQTLMTFETGSLKPIIERIKEDNEE